MPVVLIVFAALCLLPLLYVIVTYNRFVALRAHLRESWSDIDVELQRRYELIPNLVETVRGYAQHEQAVFAEVTELRNRAAASKGRANVQAADEDALQLGVGRLFAVAEAYPNLKADQHFRALHDELALTEDRLAAARRFYNGNARDLNELRQSFPSNVVASMFGVEDADYFTLSENAEHVVPRIDL